MKFYKKRVYIILIKLDKDIYHFLLVSHIHKVI